jgi:AcrR family transcriptional regulator
LAGEIEGATEPTDRRLLSIQQAADALGVSRTTIWRHFARRQASVCRVASRQQAHPERGYHGVCERRGVRMRTITLPAKVCHCQHLSNAACRFRDAGRAGVSFACSIPTPNAKKRRDAAAAEKWRLLQAQRLLSEYRRVKGGRP